MSTRQKKRGNARRKGARRTRARRNVLSFPPADPAMYRPEFVAYARSRGRTPQEEARWELGRDPVEVWGEFQRWCWKQEADE